MVVWEMVESPHDRYNRRAAERLASSVVAEAIEQWLFLADDTNDAVPRAVWRKDPLGY